MSIDRHRHAGRKIVVFAILINLFFRRSLLTPCAALLTNSPRRTGERARPIRHRLLHRQHCLSRTVYDTRLLTSILDPPHSSSEL